MSKRIYITPLVGDGTFANGYRSLVRDLIPPPVRVRVLGDARADASAGAGVVMVEVDVTDAQHATLIADARVEAVPLETGAGAAIGEDTTLTSVSAAKRTALRALLERLHVPAADFTTTHTRRNVVERMVRRFVMTQELGADDWDIDLTLPVRDVGAIKRARIRNKLWDAGYDVDVIDPNDTVGDVLRKLLAQVPSVRRTRARARAHTMQSVVQQAVSGPTARVPRAQRRGSGKKKRRR